jgi:hypothetical protein
MRIQKKKIQTIRFTNPHYFKNVVYVLDKMKLKLYKYILNIIINIHTPKYI